MRPACVLVLCAVAVVSGTENTDSRHRRSNADLFLSIVRRGPGDVNVPVFVVPINVNGNSESSNRPHDDYGPPSYAQQYQQSHTQSHKSVRINFEIASSPGVDIPDPVNNNLNPGTYDNKIGSAEVEIVPAINYEVDATQSQRPEEIVPVSNYEVDATQAQRPEEIVPAINYEVDAKGSQPAEEERIPFSGGPKMFESSSQLIQSFRRQSPVGSQLPVTIPDFPLPDRIPACDAPPVYSPPEPATAPPHPDFQRSLRLRIDLTVTTSGYTEAYDIQWDAATNTARLEVEDGSTITYRAPLSDGRVEFLEVKREAGSGKRRCTLSPRIPASPADRSFPGLPDIAQFQFKGYTSAEGRSRVERWLRVVDEGSGQGGAAAGESLIFKHEMLVVRDHGLAVPLRYTVVVDSSVLGPGSETYFHRYDLLPPLSVSLLPNTAQLCDYFDEYKDDDAEYRPVNDLEGFYSKVVSRFEPIREFALPSRSPRFETMQNKFIYQFKRKYLDPAEEAVRKTLLIKSSRFIEASNRLASGSKTAVNFMADQLDDEIGELYGVEPLLDGSTEAGMIPFPYTNNEVNQAAGTMGDEFDWRPLGAVSPVRFQETTCASCWAFAVAGSTEGALFKKTKKLVPLSPQCLVDCGKPFGTNGCNGTWPSYAYDYVKARGLPAWDEYTNYQAKVLECKDRTVPPVTHISGHVNVTAFNEPALKVAIKRHAPNVVIVDAKAQSFIFYKSGVLKDQRCGLNKPKLNHAVLAVGWGTKDGPHFIIKNTWSAKWGEGGYIRIAPDSCAVLERPSYPLIERPNIDREDLRAAAANVKDD